MTDYRVTFSEGHTKDRVASFRVRAKDTKDAYDQARAKLEKENGPIKGSPYYYIQFD